MEIRMGAALLMMAILRNQRAKVGVLSTKTSRIVKIG